MPVSYEFTSENTSDFDSPLNSLPASIAKNIRDRTTAHKREPFHRIDEPAAASLKSFSVIMLLRFGFDITADRIRCPKCMCTYTFDEMENETDEQLMNKHQRTEPNCRVLMKIVNEYGGRLRLPHAPEPVPQIHYYMQQFPAYGYNSALLAPIVQVPTVQYTSITPVATKSSNFQDDIISDSYPGMRFSGSGPSSHSSIESRSSNSSNAYSDYTSRLKSFGSNWRSRAKKHSRPSPDVLAQAGLYEYPRERKDAVKCYSCSTVIFGWSENEDVWKRHAQQSPNCAHVHKHKGDEFVRTVCAQKSIKGATKHHLLDLGIDAKWIKTVCEMGFTVDDFLLVTLYQQHKDPSRTVLFTDITEAINMLLTGMPEAEAHFHEFASKWPSDSRETDAPSDEGSLEIEEPRKYEKTQCKVCFTNTANIILRPCGHIISCESCTKRLKNCPQCRQVIAGVTKISFE